MKLKMKSNYLIVILSLIIVTLIVLFLNTWSYSIVEIEADNYKAKLHSNNKPIWATDIESYLPGNDAECFSIRTREVFTPGQRYGVRIKEKTDWTSKNGIWYSFESAPSDLEYCALYKEKKGPGYIDMAIEIRIDSKWKYFNSLKIKEIIRMLCEDNGFILKRSNSILGCDIIIKETEDGFIIGKINLKYDDEKKPSHGLYFSSYSKKHFF